MEREEYLKLHPEAANETSSKKEEPVVFHKKEDGDWRSAVTFNAAKKTPENRQYLILIYFLDNADFEFDTTFGVVTGRTEAYDYIKNLLQVIDYNKSVVILEGKAALEEQITVLQFLRHIRDDELIEDETGYLVDEILAEANQAEEDE